jgi:hypothetical protein
MDIISYFIRIISVLVSKYKGKTENVGEKIMFNLIEKKSFPSIILLIKRHYFESISSSYH